MGDSLYISLSHTKKRRVSSPEDDSVSTPKRLRIASILASRKDQKHPETKLPHHLSRLQTIFSGLQHALSHALASCSVSPSSDTGIVRNVLNHLSLSDYSGIVTHVSVDDLRQLCWLWEWDGQSKPDPFADSGENPFLEDTSSPKDWTRGSMGIILTPTSHLSSTEAKRVPAYGIGIEVDLNGTDGMTAVAKWTGASGIRRDQFSERLQSWIDLHQGHPTVPQVPKATLPGLTSPEPKTSAFTRRLLASSPSKTPSTSPTKSRSNTPGSSPFAVPFPAKSPVKAPSSTVPFPVTPRHNRADSTSSSILNPRTPRGSLSSAQDLPQSVPSTPVRQRGDSTTAAPETPSTSRRQALYERVRQKSLTSSPVKGITHSPAGAALTRDQMLKMSQDETRRRCILGRLSGVAESVWMLFTGPVSSSSTASTTRKRRALPASEVTSSIIKSSPIPISLAEAKESLDILMRLCPFFLREMKIGKEEWLEMPAQSSGQTDSEGTSPRNDARKSSPSKLRRKVPPSPGRKSKDEINAEILHRSPKRIQKETGGLREVREIIRREIELQD